MALCSLCQTIPFAALPPLPASFRGMHRMADSPSLPEVRWMSGGDDESVTLEDPIGFPWHKSLDILANSARTGCPICILAQAGVDIWTRHYQDAEENYNGWAQFYKKSQPFPDGQRLWLTKRTGSARDDGFLVLVQNPVRAHRVYLLTGGNLSVEAGSDLASRFPLRPIEQYSGSKESLDVAASITRNCFENHDRCGRELTPLPSRVLDVGSSGDTIRLLTCTPGMTGKYLCLSHCWGMAETLKTTKKSYEKRISGIALSELPKTFLDTVFIARHLDIQYIWIDSLCILQEDKDDWARESGRMTEVYSNAYLVVAANRAKDGDGGCFHDRSSRPRTRVVLPRIGEIVVQLIYVEDEAINGAEFREEPLTKRGWALQERLLGRRVLHYNNRQILFECSYGVVGEDGCHHENRYCCDLTDLGKQCHPNFERSNWSTLLWSYGDRKLTKASDKLPAMSGIAKLFRPSPDTEYIAGLWSDSILENLAWQSIGERKPMSATNYVGPSWSWASYAGIAATGLRGEWEEIGKVQDWHVDLVNEENPFGQVKAAWISIHAPITELLPGSEEPTAHEVILKEIGRTPLPRFRTCYSDDDLGKMVNFDHKDIRELSSWQGTPLQVIILHGHHQKPKETSDKGDDGQDEFSYSYGLVVTRTSEDTNSTFRRVGWMFLAKEGNKTTQDKECWKTVTLV